MTQSSNDSTAPQWQTDKAYTKGEKVSYLGINYIAAFWTEGDSPDQHNGEYGQPWKKLTGEVQQTASESDNSTRHTSAAVTLTGDAHPIEKWFTPQIWNDLFPKANHQCFESSRPYSYQALIQAVRHFPDFASQPSEIEQKKEVAALLGMSLQEVGGKSLQNAGPLTFPGLTKTKDNGFAEPTWDDIPSYKWNFAFSSEQGAERSTNYDSGMSLKPNQKYFSGAGILQLSYPANYARFSEYYFHDAQVLLDDSDRVRKEGELAIGSGIFYWMSQADNRPSPHCCFTGLAVNQKDGDCFNRITAKGYSKGLAMAICAVNGIECGIPADYRVGTRVYGYLEYGKYFGLSESELLNNCSLETADMPKNLNAVE